MAGDPKLTRHYDVSMYDPLIAEYTGECDFHNFGYWEADTASYPEATARLMERLLALVPARPERVLDVACGKGATTLHLLRRYRSAKVFGINISQKQLETARLNAPDATFACMDATELRFDDETFDLVICVEAAFHFDTREKFLREARRVLRRGGWLVLSDALVTREAERRRLGRVEENYVADLDGYGRLLRAAGFLDVRVIDGTEPCWKGHFRSLVRFSHEKLLQGEIGVDELERFMKPTYERVPDLTYYLLASGRKPDEPKD